MPERAYVIILNWNGWRDTIECLESVFRSDYPDFRVVVCDNGSEDGSVEHIEDWALAKLVVYSAYNRSQAEQGGDPSRDRPLTVIRNGKNLGFAAGCNVGLRHALARGDGAYFWLLNNDTVVDPSTLFKLVQRMNDRPDAGICGATIRSYAHRDTITVLGGARYNKWFATQKLIGAGLPADAPINAKSVESRMDYVAGASMFVSKQFLADVGLMCEDYFLYYEELDWALRGRGKYALAYAPESIVYHKEGAAIGSSDKPLARSRMADYHEIRNRLVVTRKYFRFALPTVYFGLFLTALNRIRRGQWDRARMVVNIILDRETELWN